MIAITKQQLKVLNAERGKLDIDNGKVFQGFVGRLHTDGLYHGKLQYGDAGDDQPVLSTSIKAILSSEPSARQITEQEDTSDGDTQTELPG